MQPTPQPTAGESSTSGPPRLDPLDAAEVAADPALASALDQIGEAMGFVSNDCLTLARSPALFHAVHALVMAAYAPGRVPMELKRLVGFMTSQAAGCRYCSAHARFGALRSGIAAAKLEAIWDYESSPLFEPAERAALAVARGAALTPSAVTDGDFAALREHFDDVQAVEIVGVLGLFGFLNRWNATVGTRVERVVVEAGSPRGSGDVG